MTERGFASELPSTPLTFFDIRRISETIPAAYFPPLVLAATNLGTQNVELISSIEPAYERVSIARAVRASAGYPVFFRPVEIPGLDRPSWFIDGGVISNFPAWAFSTEFRDKMHDVSRYRALAYQPWVHIGLRLIEEDVRDDQNQILPLFDHLQLKKPGTYLRALQRLLLGQARNRLEDLISRSLARSLIIAQSFEKSGGPENLLAFDSVNERRVRVMFDAGAAYASRLLQSVSYSVSSDSSSLIIKILASIADTARLVLDPTSSQHNLRVRTNIFLLSKGQLVLAYRHNMVDPETGKEDPDSRMVFTSLDQGLTGFCFLLRCPLICNLAAIATYVDNAGETLFNMTRDQQQSVCSDRTWLASSPIFDPNDLTFRQALLPPAPVPERFATRFGISMDGPVFGVVNVDANLDYDRVDVARDTSLQGTNTRIAALLDIMQTASMRLGQILGVEFAAVRMEANDGGKATL